MLLLNGQPVNVTTFPDNTSQVWQLDPELLVRALDQGMSTVDWHYTSEADVMHLLQLDMLLAKYSIASRLRIFYLPYARQDKKVGNYTTFALAALGAVFRKMHWRGITILDPHSNQACRVLSARAVYPTKMIECLLAAGNYAAVMYPDDGARRKYKDVYHTGARPVLTADKIREQETGEIIRYAVSGPEGFTGASCLIIDDICDGGRTFCEAANAVRQEYPSVKRVDLYTTHGIYSRGLTPFKGIINNVYCYKGQVDQHAGQIFYAPFPMYWQEEELC